MGMTSVQLLDETWSCSRHTAVGVDSMDNTIVNDSKNTVMKKSFHRLAAGLFGKRNENRSLL